MVRAQSLNPALQRRLQYWIAASLFSFALLASLWSGWTAFEEARELQDQQLQQIARLAVVHQVVLPPVASAEAEHSIVLQHLGEAHAGSLPLPADLADGFHTLTLQAQRWRVYVHEQHIAVSQRTEVRDELAWGSAWHTALPLLLLTPLLLGMVQVAIHRSFLPLQRLARQLDARDEHVTAALPTQGVPQEALAFINAINRLLQRLQQAMQQQRRFVADAAHELRTPVTALSLLAEHLGNAHTLAEYQTRLVPLQEGLQRLRHLVVQLLDLARLQGRNHVGFSVVDLHALLQTTLTELHPLALAKAIDLGIVRSEPLRVQGQAEALQSLLRNAVENALRYTPEGGQVDIHLFAQASDAVLWVEDSGCGIPEADLAEVCKPFYRAANHAEAGNGLGLAISQEIATQHGGNIALQNRPAGGLRFVYRQPLAQMA